MHSVSLGFTGPHTPHLSRNLASAAKHPDVICAELEKEVAAGRVLSRFQWTHSVPQAWVLSHRKEGNGG